MQRLLGRFMPRSLGVTMEEESREWMVRCASCGFERSVWELGGVRWKAVGTKWTWGGCPHCGKRGWHKISRRDWSGPSGIE